MAVDGSVTINTKIDQKGFYTGVKSIESGIGKLTRSIRSFAAAMGIAFGINALIQFGKESVRAATDASNAMMGMESIVKGQGRSFSKAKKFIDEYISDGLVPATNATTAYKNLAMRGYNDDQIQQVLIALKDSAAFGRQASLTLGDAVSSATEGLKNENSILVDNAGVTKNVSKMWDDYAKSIGTTARNLTHQQKIQAEVNGILQETRFQTGDAAKIAGGFSGQVLNLTYNFNNLKIAIGNMIRPIIQHILPAINNMVIGLTRIVNLLAQVTNKLFGQAKGQQGVTTSIKNSVDQQNDLTDAVKATGKAAKANLAPFDELNILSTQANDAGGGASAPDISVTSETGAEEDYEVTIDQKTFEETIDKLKTIGALIGIISVALIGLKIGSGLGMGLTGAIGLALTLAGAFSLIWGAIDAIQNGVDWENLTFMLGGTLALALGLTIVFGVTAGAVGLLIGGLVMLGVGIYDWIKKGELAEETFWLLEAAIVAIGVALALFLGWPALVVAAVVAAALAIYHYWDEIKVFFVNLWEEIKGIWGVVATWFDEKVVQPVVGFFSGLWKKISETASFCWDEIVKFFSPAVEWFSKLFGSIGRTISDIFYNIGVIASGCWEIIKRVWGIVSSWFSTNVIQPLARFFVNLWNGFSEKAKIAWEGVKSVFSKVANFFSDIFGTAWAKVVKVFSVAGEIFRDIKDAVLSAFKVVVNGIIRGINSVVAVPFNGINSALMKLKELKILGLSPFTSLRTISVPQIPYLATGAVIPPRSEFLAVLGDQKSGRNIESPESLLRQIVREESGSRNDGGDIHITVYTTLEDGTIVGTTTKKITRANRMSGKPVLA